LCAQSAQSCEGHVATLQQQWRDTRFDLEKVVVYGQVPDLHARIEAFFAGTKALLDLMAQLLSSEKIVVGVVDGFHRSQDVYGGRVLNVLENNTLATRKGTARQIRELVLAHKTMWIDQAIRARDLLTHPQKGMHQLMFQLDLAVRGDTIVCERIHPPIIGAESIETYTRATLTRIQSFAADFLRLLHEGSSV